MRRQNASKQTYDYDTAHSDADPSGSSRINAFAAFLFAPSCAALLAAPSAAFLSATSFAAFLSASTFAAFLSASSCSPLLAASSWALMQPQPPCLASCHQNR